MRNNLHEDKNRVVDKNGNTNYVLIKKGNQDYLVSSGSQVQSTEKALSAYVEVLGLTPVSTIALGNDVIFNEQTIETAKHSIAAGKDIIIPIISTTRSGAGHTVYAIYSNKKPNSEYAVSIVNQTANNFDEDLYSNYARQIANQLGIKVNGNINYVPGAFPSVNGNCTEIGVPLYEALAGRPPKPSLDQVIANCQQTPMTPELAGECRLKLSLALSDNLSEQYIDDRVKRVKNKITAQSNQVVTDGAKLVPFGQHASLDLFAFACGENKRYKQFDQIQYEAGDAYAVRVNGPNQPTYDEAIARLSELRQLNLDGSRNNDGALNKATIKEADSLKTRAILEEQMTTNFTNKCIALFFTESRFDLMDGENSVMEQATKSLNDFARNNANFLTPDILTNIMDELTQSPKNLINAQQILDKKQRELAQQHHARATEPNRGYYYEDAEMKALMVNPAFEPTDPKMQWAPPSNKDNIGQIKPQIDRLRPGEKILIPYNSMNHTNGVVLEKMNSGKLKVTWVDSYLNYSFEQRKLEFLSALTGLKTQVDSLEIKPAAQQPSTDTNDRASCGPRTMDNLYRIAKGFEPDMAQNQMTLRQRDMQLIANDSFNQYQAFASEAMIRSDNYLLPDQKTQQIANRRSIGRKFNEEVSRIEEERAITNLLQHASPPLREAINTWLTIANAVGEPEKIEAWQEVAQAADDSDKVLLAVLEPNFRYDEQQISRIAQRTIVAAPEIAELQQNQQYSDKIAEAASKII